MKLYYYLLLFFLLTAITVLAQDKTSRLEGKWESAVLKNQKGILISFGEDSVFTLSHVLSADYKYELNKNTLISYLQNADENKTTIDTSFVLIKPDTIVRWYNRLGWKDTVVMIKTGMNAFDSTGNDNPMAGNWKYKYPTGDTAYSTFYKSGIWHFYLPMDRYEGTYSVSGDTLITEFKNGENRQKRIFWIQGNLLGLRDINSDSEYLYRRLPD